MSEFAIVAEGIGKQYVMSQGARQTALRDILGRVASRPSKRGHRGSARQTLWALRDVSFEMKPGQVLGIIGRNGAGKSTLLRILARITRPTEGRARIWGRVGSLLEVGTGFHHELTGLENIYLSGVVLGMPKRSIEARLDEIVEFSGVGQFLSTPLKHYSTGMQTRLAFAVAAHLDPEILFVDEVLSVGDLEFQRKCLGKMDEVAGEGRSVVVVTHQMNQIRRLCTRVLWVEQGRLREAGPTAFVVSAYEKAMLEPVQSEDAQRGDTARIAARVRTWELERPVPASPGVLTEHGPVTVRLTLDVFRPILNARHAVALLNSQGDVMWSHEQARLMLDRGEVIFRYRFPMLPLQPGSYSWMVSVYDGDEVVDLLTCTPDLVIAAPVDVHQHSSDRWTGILNMPVDVTIDRREPSKSAPPVGA